MNQSLSGSPSMRTMAFEPSWLTTMSAAPAGVWGMSHRAARARDVQRRFFIRLGFRRQADAFDAGRAGFAYGFVCSVRTATVEFIPLNSTRKIQRTPWGLEKTTLVAPAPSVALICSRNCGVVVVCALPSDRPMLPRIL